MKIILGKFAGFCPGVKRAWKLAMDSVSQPGDVYLLGELVHNQQVVEKIEKSGVITVNEAGELKGKTGRVIIRAHGEPPSTYMELSKYPLEVIDATCSNVISVQNKAKQLEEEGYLVVVCGEKGHAEAVATVGQTQNGIIIDSVEEAEKIGRGKKIGVVSQTTFSESLLLEIVDVLRKNTTDFKLLGTICNFTQMARKEAEKIAKQVDLVIVVGGKKSSNTKRLAETASVLVNTYHIETSEEIDKKWFINKNTVGLLAGASTPDWIINQVKEVILKINE